MTDTNLEKLAQELADPKIFEGLSRDQINALMKARLGHLDSSDIDMVVEHAAAIAREQAGIAMKEASALDAFGRNRRQGRK